MIEISSDFYLQFYILYSIFYQGEVLLVEPDDQTNPWMLMVSSARSLGNVVPFFRGKSHEDISFEIACNSSMEAVNECNCMSLNVHRRSTVPEL